MHSCLTLLHLAFPFRKRKAHSVPAITANRGQHVIVVGSAVSPSPQVPMNLCIRLRVLVCLIVCAAFSFAQSTRIHSEYGPLSGPNQPLKRELWFRHGRVLPGQSSAALRYRAQRQKMQLRALRVAKLRAAGVTALPHDTSTTTWTPLGPVPMAECGSQRMPGRLARILQALPGLRLSTTSPPSQWDQSPSNHNYQALTPARA